MSELTNDEMEAALERFVRNQLAIAELNAEQETIKGFFKAQETLPAGTSKTIGKFYIRITSNTRIDQKLAEQKLSYPALKSVSKLVVDPVLARKRLDADVLAKITKVYENRIEIGLN